MYPIALDGFATWTIGGVGRLLRILPPPPPLPPTVRKVSMAINVKIHFAKYSYWFFSLLFFSSSPYSIRREERVDRWRHFCSLNRRSGNMEKTTTTNARSRHMVSLSKKVYDRVSGRCGFCIQIVICWFVYSPWAKKVKRCVLKSLSYQQSSLRVQARSRAGLLRRS